MRSDSLDVGDDEASDMTVEGVVATPADNLVLGMSSSSVCIEEDGLHWGETAVV